MSWLPTRRSRANTLCSTARRSNRHRRVYIALLFLLALGFGLAGWLAARAKAWSFRASGTTRLAALPSYHGWYVALWVLVPMVLFLAVWTAIAPGLVTQSVLADPVAAQLPAFGFQR